MTGINISEYIGYVVALLGVIGMLFLRSTDKDLVLLRKDNEKLWEQIGELRGRLQNTRENYVSKADFDGAMGRIFNKLDDISSSIGHS